jgi:DNA-binding transcriptional regulator YhcF (GntR family)
MAGNSRLTIAAHALAWLALAHSRGRAVLTSDEVAASINTNPVIVRRSLGDLRRAGLVVECPVGFGIRPALREVYDEAAAAFRAALARQTVAGLLERIMNDR